MIVWHFLSALLAAAAIWFLSGVLIEAIDRVAKRYNKPGFFVAFFVLGFLTSIGEISVTINSTLEHVPQIAAGNLVGASFFIFLLILPVLAIAGNGVEVNLSLQKRSLQLLLLLVLAPALFLLDGRMSMWEGGVIVVLYGLLVFFVQKKEPSGEIVETALEEVETALLEHNDTRFGKILHFFRERRATFLDLAKIIGGAAVIFFAGRILVQETIYFAPFFHVPVSFIGLLILAIGTNIPELAITLRCVLGKKNSIAFGDYLGSAATNAVLVGLLVLVNGSFTVESSEFIVTFVLLALGLVLFYIFSQSGKVLSRHAGLILLALYIVFLVLQIANVQMVEPIPGVFSEWQNLRAGVL